MAENPIVKEFLGKPKTYVINEGNGVIGCTTTEHMKAHQVPLEEYLKQVVQEARKYGDSIIANYGYPNGNWFPCGTADLVLRFNEHREIIKLFQKTADSEDRGFWRGWFGRLMKTSSQGWWWEPPMQSTQSMAFQEAVCAFVRDKLIFRDIKAYVRTYID
jgi:hypothetical protein